MEEALGGREEGGLRRKEGLSEGGKKERTYYGGRRGEQGKDAGAPAGVTNELCVFEIKV